MEGFDCLGADESAVSTEKMIKSAGDDTKKETTAQKVEKYTGTATSLIDKVVNWAKGSPQPTPPTGPIPSYGGSGLSTGAIAGIALAGLAVVGGGIYLLKKH